MNDQNKKLLTTTYENGMYMDTQEGVQPPGTYNYGRNLIPRDHNQRNWKTNEHSTDKLFEFEDTIKSYVHQEEYNRTIYLLSNESIWIQEHDKETEEGYSPLFVCRAEEFQCSWKITDCEFPKSEVYTKNCDTYFQWSSNWVYYIVNISEMLDSARKKALIDQITNDACKDCNKDCDYFRVFRKKCKPQIESKAYQTGGSLSAGAYFYSARLINSDGAVTNFADPSKVEYIYSEHNTPGEISRGKINVQFENLDCNYDKIEIATIYYSGSGVITRIIPARYFSGDKYTFDHILTEEGDPIDISEITSISTINLEGRFQMLYQNKMRYSGIRPVGEYNIQALASQVQVKFIVEKYSMDLAEKYQITSLPRGESVRFGMWVNHADGTRSYAGVLIPKCIGGGNGQSNGLNLNLSDNTNTNSNFSSTGKEDVFIDTGNSSNSNNSQGSASNSYTDGSVTQTQPLEYKRERTALEDTVQDPLAADQLLDIEKALVESYQTDVQDLLDTFGPATDPDELIGTGVGLGNKDPEECCDDPADENNQFMESRKQKRDKAILEQDARRAEEIGVKWASILGDLIGKSDKKDLVKLFSPTTIKEVALDILDSVKKRERIVIQKAKYSVNKSVSYGGSSLSGNNQSLTGGPGDEGPSNDGDTLNSGSKGTVYPGGELAGVYSPECTLEKNTKYPCMTMCDGTPVFGAHAGQQVANFKVPDESVIPTFDSKSIGVPGTITPDADEYKDVYGYYIGVEFSGYSLDEEDYYNKTGKRVCPNNPITFGQVKITDINKTILTKSLFTGGYVSSNQGKDYVYQNLGINSFEKCDRHIDIDGSRMDPGAAPHASVFGYSLDQAALEPFVGEATRLTWYSELSGIGQRHSTQVHGKDPTNKLNGRKIDVKGTVQTINLSSQTPLNQPNNVFGVEIIAGNDVPAPIAGSDMPCMNRFQQGCLWVTGPTIDIKDKSFVGDSLEHSAPITEARSYYGVLSRELDDQYGPIENTSYLPILQVKSGESSVKGLIGNRFISPYTFVKTSWVSDKIGNKFPIGNMDPTKSDRCICDIPDDAATNFRGGWFWTELPKSGDVANAKNWCGLHTPGDARTLPWSEANETGITQSDYYYWGTVTTSITYVGEWETNPWGVEVSDKLEEQRRQSIHNRSQFAYHAISSYNTSHEDTLLDSTHIIKVKQPSFAEKKAHSLIKSITGVALAYFGLSDLLNPESVPEFGGDLTQLPLYVALYFLVTKVLITEDWLHDFIGLEKCKTDDEGGIDFDITNLYIPFNKYSTVYNKQQDIYSVQQMPEPKTCCPTDELSLCDYTNDIYTSDPLIETSTYMGVNNVRPNNFVRISSDKGRVTDVYQLNGGLFADTTDAKYSLILPQTQIPTNTLPIIGGTGNNVVPQLIMGSNPEGYAGLHNRYHAVNSALGRVQVDYDAGIIYIFTGNDMKPISFNGAYNFFREYTKFCSGDIECCEQQGKHYAIGYDPKIQRVLITKHDSGDLTKDSWTVSYDLLSNQGKGSWISFHDYIPHNYLNTRDKFYMLTEKGVYLQDSKYAQDNSLGFGKYLDQEKANDTLIDTQHVSQYAYYTNHIISTEVRKYTDGKKIFYNLDKSPHKLGFWNSRQTSGIHNLMPVLIKDKHTVDTLKDKSGNIIAYKKQNSWRVHELHEYTVNPNEPLVEYLAECLPHIKLINYLDNTGRMCQNSTKNNLADNWFMTRLIWENSKEESKEESIYFKSLSLQVRYVQE